MPVVRSFPLKCWLTPWIVLAAVVGWTAVLFSKRQRASAEGSEKSEPEV